jgi:hypothetical protein
VLKPTAEKEPEKTGGTINMTRNKIIKKSVVTLAAAAVLFAITSNVAEAAKVNPNPIGKPVGGGTVFEGKKTDVQCDYEMLDCRDTVERDCQNSGSGLRRTRYRGFIQKCEWDGFNHCTVRNERCRKDKKKKKRSRPSTTGTMNPAPMKQHKMAPMKQYKMAPLAPKEFLELKNK